MKKYLVLDIGGSSIKYAMMNESAEFLSKGSVKTPLDCIESLVEIIGQIYDDYKFEIEGMAISMPGVLDSDTGYAYSGGWLKYNSGQNIIEVLKKRCNTVIAIENDAKCAASAELGFGSLKGCKDAAVIVLGTGVGGGHDEREQTLNQMLVEMDGFGVNEGIIMIAATNRVDILDPAILRPGRFDRKVGVGRPDVKGREDILKIHCRQKPLGDDVDLHEIARTTAGFVGADLENLMNEAAIQAARDDRAYIMKEDIDKSFIKVGIGTEKKSRVVPESERRITAYHESGHAILFHLLPDVGPVYTVSIIPTGTGAAGYTMPLPENDNVFMTRGKMIQDIMVSLGGRIAEELILDDITTGASQDIKQVTQYARAMVTKFGMSDELGLINYDSGEGDEVFLGKEIGQQRPYGENTQTVIDQEVKKIVNKCYKDAKAMIEEHIDVLHKCAALLLEKERINRAEFEALFEPETEVETQA